MLQLIPQSSYLKMPWKNKKGSTSQILIYPPAATLEKLDFDFRLSSAPVLENGFFSKFEGMKRILLPIKGKGFSLNGALYELHEIAYFEGSADTHCELVNGEILDLGLIYHPLKVTADAKVLNFKGSFKINTETANQYLIYTLRGSVSVNGSQCLENDSLLAKEESSLDFQSAKNAMIVLFTVSKI